jgi:peptide chain release factor 2
LKSALWRWGGTFDLENKQERLLELDRVTSDPNFWNEADKAQVVSRERSEISALIDRAMGLKAKIEDLRVLADLICESGEESEFLDLSREIDLVEPELSSFELGRMLSGPHDVQNAILEVNAGAGGTEAQDWAEMLLRMYVRWAEKKKFKTDVLDINTGDEAGIKSCTLYVEGTNAYGYLRSERGVHRLVRISPFDSNARRHTSFASVSVMPDIEEEIDVEIKTDDLRIDTFRAGGAGGQHINKTDSAVRITHIPTGIVVACQNDRSQHKNKAYAMKMLKSKLYEVEAQKQREELAKIAGERKKIDFGSQIRNYVMQPYQLVKDARTDVQTSDVTGVMDGDIDRFIEGYLLDTDLNID